MTGTRIGIFGTGSALRDFLSILPAGHEVLALADNDATRHGGEVAGHRIVSPQALVALEPELIVIAARASDAIRAQLEALGVPGERIAAYYPSYSEALARAVNADLERLNGLLGLGLPMAGIATMYLWPEAEVPPGVRAGLAEDFVRRQSMRLAADWVRERRVAGSIAELGVYQGEQAALINALFPDRPLHLFDTFEGFAAADVQREAAAGFSTAAPGDFRDTSVEQVRARLPHPDAATFHVGMFPESLGGLEERFAFVSLDVDLYEPTLAGLRYFHPRLNPGGFIFIHDYNNRRYMGVRQAVADFLAEAHAPALPLPDFAGTLVVMK